MNDSKPRLDENIDQDKATFSRVKENGFDVNADENSLKKTESSEATIRRVLNGYDLGQKLRQLRLHKKIALTDLGKHTGLSASMLSQLENGKLIPTLPTLARIAMVFDVGLEHFFGEKKHRRTFSVVRAEDRLRFPELPDSPVPGYFFEVLAFGAPQKSMSCYLAEFPRRSPEEIQSHSHEGSEFVHVTEGILAINYQAEEHVLEAGDSVYFDSSEAHSYCGKSETPAKAFVVTNPPRL